MMASIGRGIAAVVVALGLATGTPVRADTTALATGPELGTYRPVGVALKLLLEKTQGPQVAVETTAGSIANIEGLRSGRYALAIVQGDTAEEAFRGGGPFAAQGSYGDLRAVLELHEEALALVVRPGVRIKGIEDLRGRAVDLGMPGSGGRAVADRLVSGLGKGGVKPVDLGYGEAAGALCDKRIDAAFLVIGHPSAVLVDVLSRCRSKLLPVDGPLAESVIRTMPPVRKAVIPGHAYADVRKPVPTLGVPAILVARADVPDAVVAAVLTAVHSNRELFRRLHPALATLRDGPLQPDALTVPLHPAAQRFFEANPPAR